MSPLLLLPLSVIARHLDHSNIARQHQYESSPPPSAAPLARRETPPPTQETHHTHNAKIITDTTGTQQPIQVRQLGRRRLRLDPRVHGLRQARRGGRRAAPSQRHQLRLQLLQDDSRGNGRHRRHRRRPDGPTPVAGVGDRERWRRGCRQSQPCFVAHGGACFCARRCWGCCRGDHVRGASATGGAACEELCSPAAASGRWRRREGGCGGLRLGSEVVGQQRHG